MIHSRLDRPARHGTRSHEDGDAPRRPRLRQVLWRGARKRCPHCGQGPVFVRWMTMHDTCRVCGLRYLQNQGDTWLYWIVMDRIPIAIGLILIVFFGLRVASWQAGVLFFGGMAVPLVATMPRRQGVAVALNYLSRVYFPDPSDPIPLHALGRAIAETGESRVARSSSDPGRPDTRKSRDPDPSSPSWPR